MKHFTSKSCKGEKCSICRNPATHKIGEEIFDDDGPLAYRHNFTAYVCCACFGMIFGPSAKKFCKLLSEMAN